MPLTLNQILSRIRTLALSHDQINDFYFGDPHEFDIKGGEGDVNYAACFLSQQPGTIDRTEHLQKFVFDFFLLDRVGVSNDTEGNETEVLSDMSRVAADILAMLNFFEYQNDWIIEEVSTVTPVTEELGDMVAGVILRVSIGVDFLSDRCEVPASDQAFEDEDGGIVLLDPAKKPRTLTYTSAGDSGDSFTVPGLAGKLVIAAFRAGYYKRVTTGTPDSEMVKVMGTQKVGGIEASGVVALASGDSLIDQEKLDFIYYG